MSMGMRMDSEMIKGERRVRETKVEEMALKRDAHTRTHAHAHTRLDGVMR